MRSLVFSIYVRAFGPSFEEVEKYGHRRENYMASRSSAKSLPFRVPLSHGIGAQFQQVEGGARGVRLMRSTDHDDGAIYRLHGLAISIPLS